MADFHLETVVHSPALKSSAGEVDIKFHHKSSVAVIKEERTVFDISDLTHSVCLCYTAQKYVATHRVHSVLSVKSK